MENLINYIEQRKNHLITLFFLLLVSLILMKNMTPSSAEYLKTGVLLDKNIISSNK